MKEIFSSHFTLTILSKLHRCYKPSQIADQLGVTPQDIHYHTNKMVEAQLIYKDASSGIKWRLTEKGKFILKQKLTGTVNSLNNYQTARIIPTRLDNLSFAFKISSPIPEDPHLDWTEIRNGVSKCSLKYETHTVELVKSDNSSTMLVHLDKKYCFDWHKELIDQYNLASYYAKQAAIKFSLQISDYGYPIKKPHIAFEQDLIACYLAASCTAEIKTKQGEGVEGDEYRTWVDSSNGAGELETDNDEYGYDYLMMPKTVREIANMTMTIIKQITGYERCYHPLFTVNN
jgi:DNA-binding MarR family transcriptional regulator